MTALQLEPSAQAPWTRTMLGSAVMSGLLAGLRAVCSVLPAPTLSDHVFSEVIRRIHVPDDHVDRGTQVPAFLPTRAPACVPAGFPRRLERSGLVGLLKATGSRRWRGYHGRHHGASLRFDPGQSGEREAVQPLQPLQPLLVHDGLLAVGVVG